VEDGEWRVEGGERREEGWRGQCGGYGGYGGCCGVTISSDPSDLTDRQKRRRIVLLMESRCAPVGVAGLEREGGKHDGC